jgi:hypothetical protein
VTVLARFAAVVAVWVTLDVSWTPQLGRFVQLMIIVMAVATAGLLVWRFVTGAPPRRRALAIGAPIALLFLIMQASYRTMSLFFTGGAIAVTQPVQNAVQWSFTAARSAIWYRPSSGFSCGNRERAQGDARKLD